MFWHTLLMSAVDGSWWAVSCGFQQHQNEIQSIIIIFMLTYLDPCPGLPPAKKKKHLALCPQKTKAAPKCRQFCYAECFRSPPHGADKCWRWWRFVIVNLIKFHKNCHATWIFHGFSCRLFPVPWAKIFSARGLYVRMPGANRSALGKCGTVWKVFAAQPQRNSAKTNDKTSEITWAVATKPFFVDDYSEDCTGIYILWCSIEEFPQSMLENPTDQPMYFFIVTWLHVSNMYT